MVFACDYLLDWLQVHKTKVETWTVQIPHVQSHEGSAHAATAAETGDGGGTN